MRASEVSCCSGNGPRRTPDLAVVGAGSAGFAAAIRAAELGVQVTLIGHGTIGGTCVNIGCVPSKALIRAVESLHHAKRASRFSALRGQDMCPEQPSAGAFPCKTWRT
jgi:mercuric reductase